MRKKLKNVICKIMNFFKNNINYFIKNLKEILNKIFSFFKKILPVIFKFIVIPVFFLILFFLLPIFFEKFIAFLVDKKIIMNNFETSYIDFYATILSGLFTLIGVVFTIKYESNQKKSDETITYKPILVVDGINKNINCMVREVGLGMGFSCSNSDPDRERKCEEFYEQQKSDNPKYRLYIKNKGRGETFNAVLDDFKVVDANWDKETNVHSNISGNQYIGEVLKDEYIGIDVNLPNYLFMPEKMGSLLWYELRTDTFISYSDMFDRIRYQYRIHTVYKVIVEEFSESQPYFYKEGFKYAKVSYELLCLMPEMRIYSKKQKKFIHEQKYVKEKFKKN